MTRETRQQKARRLRDNFRVVLSCDDRGLVATVTGDSATYRLTLTEYGWRCPCRARLGDCSHVLAVKAVMGR